MHNFCKRRRHARAHGLARTDRGAAGYGRGTAVRELGSADLQSRFGTTSQAAAAGYFKYTTEDQTGAISWVNTKNWQSDPQHPSQLWYDVNGKLIGADFSVLQTGSAARPNVWGISASRWLDFSPAHVHFAIKTPSGLQYGGVGSKTMAKVGGSLENPTAADIVKIAKTPRWKVLGIPAPSSASDVAFVFEFPALWELQVWLVPNPLGAFAEHNPNVVPKRERHESGSARQGSCHGPWSARTSGQPHKRRSAARVIDRGRHRVRELNRIAALASRSAVAGPSVKSNPVRRFCTRCVSTTAGRPFVLDRIRRLIHRAASAPRAREPAGARQRPNRRSRR